MVGSCHDVRSEAGKVEGIVSSMIEVVSPQFNVYAAVILATLVGAWLLDLVARRLDLAHLTETLPDELSSLYDPERYRQSQRYTRVRTRFGAIAATIELAALLAFWGIGGFSVVDGGSRWLAQAFLGAEHPLVVGVLFVGILVLGQMALGLPLSLYSTFVIEQRFGFNRTTPRTFGLDLIKGLAVAAVLGIPAVCGVIAFFEYGGAHAWLWAWLAASLFTLAVQYVVPTWVLPLFNRFEPLAEGELRERLFDMADRVGFPVGEIFVIDGSKRSSKANAFFTGIGRHKRIALFDTLVDRHSPLELEAVLAHEIGHYKKGHIRRGLVLSILHLGLMFFLLSIFLDHRGLYEAFGLEPSTWAGLVLFGLLLSPMEVILGLLLNWLSRRHEFEADRFAVAAMGEGESLVSALEALSVDHLANLTPHPLRVFLDYSHPPLLVRTAAIRREASLLD